MGEWSGVQLPVQETYISIYPVTQVNSAPIPPWAGAMSTSQRAVMLCGWGVKAGMVHVWVAGKMCDPYTCNYNRDEFFIIKCYTNRPYNTIQYN